MHSLQPAFIDITWGAGGRHSNLTCEMIKTCQEALGLEVSNLWWKSDIVVRLC